MFKSNVFGIYTSVCAKINNLSSFKMYKNTRHSMFKFLCSIIFLIFFQTNRITFLDCDRKIYNFFYKIFCNESKVLKDFCVFKIIFYLYCKKYIEWVDESTFIFELIINVGIENWYHLDCNETVK